MPTRKQRRRRAKELRHEYVWEDEEGNEVAPDDAPSRKGAASSSARGQTARRGREPQPPSWRRTLRRALIFLPVMFVVISFLSKDLSLVDRVVQTLLIGLVFVPFSYLLDGLFYRQYQRRLARAARSNGHRRS